MDRMALGYTRTSCGLAFTALALDLDTNMITTAMIAAQSQRL
jgi:hypothetical protein